MAGTGGGGGRGVAPSRLVLGVLLAVLAGLLTPLALVAGWAHGQVTDTDAFIARYGALAQDPRVQEAVTTSLTDAITDQLGLGDNRLAVGLVRRTVTEFGGSEAFDSAWTIGLRVAHAELRALLTGDPGRLQVVDGQVQVRFAPFADAVTARLSAAGVPFLDRLPEVTGGITVLRVDPGLLPGLQAVYRVLDVVSAWLGWLAAAVAIAAVLVWPSTRAALITVGAAVAVGVVVVWVVTATVVGTLLGGLAAPFDALAGALAETALSPLESPALACAVTGVVVAVLASLAGPAPAD